MSPEQQEEYQLRIHEMRNRLADILQQEPPHIGISAFFSIMFESIFWENRIDKQHFLDQMSQAWDHYKKQEEALENMFDGS